ncbi:MAG TPA: hypothetical protein VKT78_11240 [Fimbriimonadaceae bacterium]|nr:hypothetical protein [Fimbriimonadaceae bacterium]
MNFDPSNPQYRSVRSRLAQAFQEPANVVGLAGMSALALALLNPIPVLCAVVAEAAYLLFVPDTAWFTKRMESRFDAEVRAHREQLKNKVFPKIRDEILERYNWLEQARVQIEQTSTVQDKWFREALRKLDFLLEKYLQFAERESEYLAYLLSLLRESFGNLSRDEIRDLPSLARYKDAYVPPHEVKISQQDVQALIDAIQNHYEGEIKTLTDSSATEQVMATRDILTKRMQVLTRRKEFIVRLSDMMVNLRHQMELIAETFGLINDELRARSPEQVLADIDEVVNQATSLTDALDSMTPADQVVN